MLEIEPNGNETAETAATPEEVKPKKATRARKTAKAKAAPEGTSDGTPDMLSDNATNVAADTTPSEAAPQIGEEKPARRRRTAAVFAAPPAPEPLPAPEERSDEEAQPRKRRAAPAAAIFVAPVATEAPRKPTTERRAAALSADEPAADEEQPTVTRTRRRSRRAADVAEVAVTEETESETEANAEDEEEDEAGAAKHRRRRGRRGRGRGKGHETSSETEDEEEAEASDAEESEEYEEGSGEEGMTRRRRRRRRRGSGGAEDVESEEGVVTVVKIREPRPARDEVQGVSGSTRLEAKRQRRRDGRDQRRTRPSILSESEFLARRESVDRVMAIRQKGDRTQIAVLEDGVLVEHYVARASSGSMVGNVYLGKVQNVLPSMEAAFVDIGRGRNAVLYAGEVNWDMAGLEGRARSIEQALKSGDSVLVQVTKDPIGHKGARLTSHVALSGRHLVYVPNGNASGISRKLPDNERKRLRDILKKLVPEGAGVIVRTAAEGASEDELERDVKRLSAQWADIENKVAAGGAPVQLYEEPDLVIRVVRDLFNEDFRELVIQGTEAYETVENYLGHVSPDLVERLRRHAGTSDIFAVHRIDEQILKGLDRKVFLPSGGSLVIDRTEAMTVIDVNTGKYTGTGGNLEETVTRNNLEAAEEIVRQLRLRDLGGIVVIDFIDMVLESNRELVLRRLTECLGRDRTKHQVTEITSLGLVQMTRKRIGQGLLEAFSETCEHCKGRGLIMHLDPVPDKRHVPAGHDHEPEAPPTRRGRSTASLDDERPGIDEDVEAEVDAASEASEGSPAAAPVAVPQPQAAAATWQPKASGWVNLAATPPATASTSPAAAATPNAAASAGDPEVITSPAAVGDAMSVPSASSENAAPEGDVSGQAGRRRRGSRWRLRP